MREQGFVELRGARKENVPGEFWDLSRGQLREEEGQGSAEVSCLYHSKG